MFRRHAEINQYKARIKAICPVLTQLPATYEAGLQACAGMVVFIYKSLVAGRTKGKSQSHLQNKCVWPLVAPCREPRTTWRGGGGGGVQN